MKIRPVHIRIRDSLEISETHIEIKASWQWDGDNDDLTELEIVEVVFMLPRSQKPLDAIKRDAEVKAREILQRTTSIIAP
jgi:hypothetical protein